MSRRVASTITSSYSRMRSPWKGGSRSFRWRRCSGPVSTITEWRPMTDATGELPAPEGATSGGAVNTVLDRLGVADEHHFHPAGEEGQREGVPHAARAVV